MILHPTSRHPSGAPGDAGSAFGLSSNPSMNGVLSWVASSGVVQGVIIGATLAFLTTIRILDAVAKAETTTVNGWSSIPRAGRPDNGWLVRAALQKALPVVNVLEEAAYWTASVDSAGG